MIACAKTGAEARAFSLIELLCVIAIVSLLLVMSVPFLSGQSNSRNLSGTVLSASLLLEQARAFALANRTYVWVGFNDSVNSSTLTVAVVAGSSGSESDIRTSESCRPLIKPKEFNQIQLSSVEGLPGMFSEADRVESSKLANFEQIVAGRPVTFSRVIQFTPSGGVRIENNTVSRWVQIGVQSLRGATADQDNRAALQIAGLTGQVRIFRNDAQRLP